MKSKTILCYERHPLRIAMDAAPASLARNPATPASVPAKPATSPKPAAPKKPAVDSPSRQEGLQAILDFLSGALPPRLFAEVEAELGRYVHGSQDPSQMSSPPATDRRPRFAGDSASASDFSRRFPSARRIGFA
jgi:hypothetical protein